MVRITGLGLAWVGRVTTSVRTYISITLLQTIRPADHSPFTTDSITIDAVNAIQAIMEKKKKKYIIDQIQVRTLVTL